MNPDELLNKKADRWDYYRTRGYSEADATRAVEEEFKPMSKREAVVTGLSSGIPGAEMMAGITSALLGGTYRGGRQSVAQRQQMARETIGGKGYGAAELAGSIAAGLPAMRAPSAIGRALGFGAMGGLRGVSRADTGGDESPTLLEMLSGGARGATGEAIGSYAGEKLLMPALAGAGRVAARASRLPIVSLVTGPVASMAGEVGGAVSAGRRQAADFLMSPEVQKRLGARAGSLVRSAAETIEPSDATRIQRILREELQPTGQTAQEFVEQARASGRTARAAESAAQRQAQAAALQAVGPTAATQETARQQARATMDALKAEARRVVPGVGVTGADALRTLIRNEQLAAGKQSYNVARQLGASPDVNLLVDPLSKALENPTLRMAYDAALKRGGAQAERVVVGEGNAAQELLIPDLEGLDLMRQAVRKRQAELVAGNATGPERNYARNALNEIRDLERAYLDALPVEAGQALRAARAQYHEYFNRLRALQDGLNLSRFGFGKPEGLLTSAQYSLPQLERRLADEATTPEAREAFKIGAAEWVNGVLMKSPDDALTVARAFVGTPERARRARLALGDEAVQTMEDVLRQARQARSAAQGAGSTIRVGRQAVTVPETEAANQARELARQIASGVRSLSGGEAAAGFARGIAPQMSPFASTQARNVMTSAIDREIAGMAPDAAMARIAELRKNPSVSLMFGRELAEAERKLLSRAPMAGPIRGAVGAYMGRQQTRQP